MKAIDFKNTELTFKTLNGKELAHLWRINSDYDQIKDENILNKTKEEFEKFEISFQSTI